MFKQFQKPPRLGVLIALGFGAAVLFSLYTSGYEWSFMRPQQRTFQTIEINGQSLEVVIAQTPAEIKQGLSDQVSLRADGMLFVLPTVSQPTFWMYRMKFPLDFVWIRDGVIVDLHSSIAPPTTKGGTITEVRPQEAVTHVLEVPAGWIEQHRIQSGMSVIMKSDQQQRMW